MALKGKKNSVKKELLKKIVGSKVKKPTIQTQPNPLSGNGSNLGTNGIF